MPHTPSDFLRGRVIGLAQAGLPQEKIARVLDMTLHALRKNYKAELESAMADRVAEVATRLFTQATSDKDTQANTIARIFILKCQGRWKEVHTVEHVGEDGKPIPPAQTLQIILPHNGRGTELAAKHGLLREATPAQIELLAAPVVGLE